MSRMGMRGITVKTKGLRELDRFLDEQIAGEDLNPAKRQLRQGTKVIATDVVIPALKAGAESSGVPQAPKMAATARTRTDRVVFVRIGAVNPKLSGFKRGIGHGRADSQGRKRNSASYRTTLAWGSDKGPHPENPTNVYTVPRSPLGYWVKPSISGVLPEVKARYAALLDQILRDYGKYR